MGPGPVDILMYHSLSDGAGPTCIRPDVFRRQLNGLAEAGYRVASLAARAGAGPTAVLTFDDGFADFAEVAAPELRARGWSATVFVPAAKVGGPVDWPNAGGSVGRLLLSWAELRNLADHGIEIGAHGLSHVDLTTLTPDEWRNEIVGSKKLIEDRIGRPVASFAAPYGRTTAAIRAELAKHYTAAVGTTLGPATPASDRFDLPRLEMWYFRSPDRWRAYLGGARGYLRLRQTLRQARRLLTH